mgnify:CR=1 FL=1
MSIEEELKAMSLENKELIQRSKDLIKQSQKVSLELKQTVLNGQDPHDIVKNASLKDRKKAYDTLLEYGLNKDKLEQIIYGKTEHDKTEAKRGLGVKARKSKANILV